MRVLSPRLGFIVTLSFTRSNSNFKYAFESEVKIFREVHEQNLSVYRIFILLQLLKLCQYCRGTSKMSNADASSDKNVSCTVNDNQQPIGGRHSGSDSALDSGHSCCEEASLQGERGRSSHSSESSGKYSLRESVASGADCEPAQSNPQSIAQSPVSPGEVFNDDKDIPGPSGNNDLLRPMQSLSRPRKVSKGSNSSDRGSVSSVSSITAVLQARLGRSISLKVRGSRNASESLNACSVTGSSNKQHRRAVSLRLPRSHKRGRDADTNLPTIYVEDSPKAKQRENREFTRKSSLRRALSLLSMNSLVRQDSTNHQKQQKPVQKILRQPRRRHNTVRGLSGMAIDDANQPVLQRAGTLYYPTATSLRRSYAARRTYSDSQY
ncbi:hypothetical protein SK128_013160 [Halocaridina rubra]|uniref:Uncharacterized protein n=1 Tax=Halocaridina rubra TaxID=373956 RepID=A0AAN8WBF9_HALRR